MLLGSYVILAVVFLFVLGLAVTYTLSMYTGHVKLIWCFISYTGNFPIESCIFSLVLNLCSWLYILIIILRHCQIIHVFEKSRNLPQSKLLKKVKLMSEISLAVGLIGAIGLSTAGSFQQRHVHFMHMIGVFCCTCGTNTYLLFQTYFSYTVMSSRTKTSVKIFRLLIVLASSAAMIIGSILALWFFAKNPHRLWLVRSALQDDPSEMFKAGTVLEWFLFFATLIYFSSLYTDFRKIGLTRDQIIFLN